MAIPAINVLGNPNVTEGNFQVAIEDLRKSVIGSGKVYDSANTYSEYDTCMYGGVEYYSKINSNTGNTPAIGANWGNVIDLINLTITNGAAFGYGSGSGGTAVQGANKTDSIPINKSSGVVTMSNTAMASNATLVFQITNSFVGVNDTVDYNISGGVVSLANYRLEKIGVVPGVIGFRLTNVSIGTLSEAIRITFNILKGASI